MSELAKTLVQEAGLHIENVYFDGQGHHYFNVQEIVEKNTNGQKIVVSYGSTKRLTQQITVGKENKDVEVTVGKPETKIISTMTRKEILEQVELEVTNPVASEASKEQKENMEMLKAQKLLEEKDAKIAKLEARLLADPDKLSEEEKNKTEKKK